MLLAEMDGLRRLRAFSGWLGPLALAGYFLWQLSGLSTYVRADIVWIAVVAASVVVVSIARRRPPTPIEVMALEVLVASLANGLPNSAGGGLRDLRLYLAAGADFLAGQAT